MVAASELFASTAQLVRLNDRKLPTGLASGMALRYSGVTYLLTVGHALVDGISLQLGNNLKGMACWPLQNGYYVLSSSQCFSLIRGCPFEKSWDLNDPSVVDAALFKLPEDCSPVRYIVIQGEGASQLPVKVFDVPEPGVKICGICSFCGMVDPQPPDPNEPYGIDYRFYFYQKGAAFTKVEHDYDAGCYRYFTVRDIDDMKQLVNFQGCSGAPLLDESGALIAMVCGIDLDKSRLKAIDIGRVFPLLHHFQEAVS